MLLLMLVALYQPVDQAGKTVSHCLQQPDRVASIQHFYAEKLQTYLDLRWEGISRIVFYIVNRLGQPDSWGVLNSLYQTIHRIRQFSVKLRVTGCHL